MSPGRSIPALANRRLALQARRVHRARRLFREQLVLLVRRVRLRQVRRALPVRVEVVAREPPDYRALPDSLPAADFVQPVAVAAVAVLEFRADFARTRLARRR